MVFMVSEVVHLSLGASCTLTWGSPFRDKRWWREDLLLANTSGERKAKVQESLLLQGKLTFLASFPKSPTCPIWKHLLTQGKEDTHRSLPVQFHPSPQKIRVACGADLGSEGNQFWLRLPLKEGSRKACWGTRVKQPPGTGCPVTS